MDYGALTLIPIAVIIVMAIVTRHAFESLIVGAVISCIIMSRGGFLLQFMERVLRAVSDRDNQWVLLLCGLFGSLIALLRASNGIDAFTRMGERLCKTQRGVLLGTFVLGIVIFVDDYLNMLTVGTCMRKISDRRRVPREALAYLLDSTGTPVCVLLPFSTWSAFYISLFIKEDAVRSLGFDNGVSLYIRCIPYIFYAILTVMIVFLFAMGWMPKLGAMKKAYERVENGGPTYGPASEKLNREQDARASSPVNEAFDGNAKDSARDPSAETEASDGNTPVNNAKGAVRASEQGNDAFGDNTETAVEVLSKGKLCDFLIPIVTLIVCTMTLDDILIAVIASLFVTLFLYLPRKVMTFGQWSRSLLRGFRDMIPTLAILVGAFTVAQCMNEMKLPEYIIQTVLPFSQRSTFPVVIFLVVALLTFATSSTWGVSTIIVPIILPLAAAVHANLILTMAAILSGSTFGSHACFYSDATVLASVGARIDTTEHALSQIPYALIAAAGTVILYLVMGMIL